MSSWDVALEAMQTGKPIVVNGANTPIKFDLEKRYWLEVESGLPFHPSFSGFDWVFYEEPKPKVKRWRWIQQRSNLEFPFDNGRYYTENEAEENLGKITQAPLIKIEDSVEEFDE